MLDLRNWGPVTVLVTIAAMIVLVVGGIVCIVNPDTLTFAQYLDDLKTFVIGLGLTGLARGVHLGAQHLAAARAADDAATLDLSAGPAPLSTPATVPDGEPAGA
jgi:hypothetical protein